MCLSPTKELWLALKQDFPEVQFIAERATSSVEWSADLKSAATMEKRSVAMYTIWNIWLQRKRRTFQGISATAATLFLLIKEGGFSGVAVSGLAFWPEELCGSLDLV